MKYWHTREILECAVYQIEVIASTAHARIGVEAWQYRVFESRYNFDVTVAHAFARGQTFSIQLEDAGLDGLELDGLPNGIIDNIRELARCKLCPIRPVCRSPEGVVGHRAILAFLRRQVAEGGDGLLHIPVDQHLCRTAEE